MTTLSEFCWEKRLEIMKGISSIGQCSILVRDFQTNGCPSFSSNDLEKKPTKTFPKNAIQI
jgi:hypothetical protein